MSIKNYTSNIRPATMSDKRQRKTTLMGAEYEKPYLRRPAGKLVWMFSGTLLQLSKLGSLFLQTMSRLTVKVIVNCNTISHNLKTLTTYLHFSIPSTYHIISDIIAVSNVPFDEMHLRLYKRTRTVTNIITCPHEVDNETFHLIDLVREKRSVSDQALVAQRLLFASISKIKVTARGKVLIHCFIFKKGNSLAQLVQNNSLARLQRPITAMTLPYW